MAGLLNFGQDFNDPRTQGLLGLASGLLAASGPSRTPVSLGQAFGQGLLHGNQMQQQAQQTALNNKLVQAKIDEADLEKQRQAKVAGLIGTPAQPFTDYPTMDGEQIPGLLSQEGTGVLGGKIPAQSLPYLLAGVGGDYTKYGLKGLGIGNDVPSVLQEWQFFNALPKADQARYLEMKRNPTIMNLGGTQAVRAPGGGIGEQYPVTLKPGEQPSVHGDQARAAAQAKSDVEIATGATKQAIKTQNIADIATRANELLDKATGSYVGTAVSFGKRAVGYSDEKTKANQDLQLIGGWLVSNVPRMEGPQSDYDVENYKLMAAKVGDSTVPIGDRKAALDELVKLTDKYKQNATPANLPSAPTGVTNKVRRYNPTTGKIE